MLPVGDRMTWVVEQALDGLRTRADVRADNLANLNTPGFRAREVDFASALRTAMSTGQAGSPVVADVGFAPTPPNPSGSTVDLENELIGMMQDNLTRDALVNAFNFKISVLRTAIGGQ